MSRDDWIAHGSRVLAQNGVAALKAEPLARQLGVSRGSFYWHFQDIQAFHRAVLEHWRARSTLQVIRRIEARRADRLATLMGEAFEASWELERAVRAWASQATWVAEEVAQVDEVRLTFLEQLLLSEGLSASTARARALLLYWAALGQMLTPGMRLKRGAVSKLAQMLLHR
ncbi:MAG: helix-turn-helix domain-containing protein [Pseudomonadota bacterium]